MPARFRSDGALPRSSDLPLISAKLNASPLERSELLFSAVRGEAKSKKLGRDGRVYL